MKKILENKKDYILIALIITCAAIFIFYPYIFNGVEFEIIADQQLQYQLFYDEWIRLIENFINNKTLPFYSFNTFLGSDFFTSKMYYVTGDIFVPIIFLFKDLNLALLFITILLLYISGFSINLLLKYLGIRNKYIRITFSIIYAFSGIASLYFGNYMFHRFYALMPLLFVGIEKYFKNNKKGLFSLMIFILFLQNYYFMFPTSIFLVIYYFISYSIKFKFNLRKIIISSLPLIGAYGIGLLASSIILIPTINFLANNTRVGSSDYNILWNIKVYIGYFFSLITPPFNINTNIPFMFYHGNNGHEYWYSVYTGSITTLLIFSAFFTKNRKIKILLRGYLILLAILFICPLNSIMHGFSEPSFRWTFLIVFLQVINGAFMLDNIDSFKHSIKKGFILLIITFLIMLLIGLLSGIINVEVHYISLSVTLLVLFLIILCTILINKRLYKLILILVCIEMIISSGSLVKIYAKNYYEYTPTLTKEYVDYFNDLDGPLHRIYLNPEDLLPSSTLNLNQSLYYDYMSTTTYDSTYEYVLNDFLRWNNINWHIINLDNPRILKLLGAKYVGVIKEEQLDNINSYIYDHNLNHIKMYQITDYNNIAHSFSKIIKKSEFETIENKTEFDWNSTLIVEDEDFENFDLELSDKSQFYVETLSNNYFYGKISVDQESILFISIPYSSGWRVQYDTGENLETYKVDGGFLGVLIKSGTSYISFNYIPPYLKISSILSFIGLIGIFVLILLDFFKKKKEEFYDF